MEMRKSSLMKLQKVSQLAFVLHFANSWRHQWSWLRKDYSTPFPVQFLWVLSFMESSEANLVTSFYKLCEKWFQPWKQGFHLYTSLINLTTVYRYLFFYNEDHKIESIFYSFSKLRNICLANVLTPIAAKTMAKLSLWSSRTPFLNFTKPAWRQIWAAI